MINEILLFTGLSAAGKSTLAGEINLDLQYGMVNERALLHDLARSKGYDRTRQWILTSDDQETLPLARDNTVTRINSLNENHDGVILDGCYDSQVPSTLAQEFPTAKIILIAVTIPDSLRLARMIQRLGTTYQDAVAERDLIDGWKKRVGVEELIDSADILVVNDDKIPKVAEGLLSKVKTFRHSKI